MKTKPYPQLEEKPMMAAEPVVAYQHTASAMYPSKCGYTQEEMDKMEAEWLRPFTMEELHRMMDEAEAEIEAGEVMTCEEANAEIRRLLPWLS